MDRQVHLRFTKYRTGRLRPVYNYRRQDRTDKYPNNVCTTTVDLEDPVDVKFLDVTPNIYGVCTTTKRVQLLPLRPVNDYFPRRF